MNWQTIIESLVAAGMSETEIGDAVGLHQTTVNRLRRGTLKTIQYEKGQRLVELGKARTAVRKRAEARRARQG